LVGHIVGVVVALAAYGVLSLILDDASNMSNQTFAIAGAISVGVAILLMAVTNTEQPPSAGTALSLVAIGAIGASLNAIWFILSAALILAGVRFLLQRWMVNLL
jgi:CBS-domain-containing membrane protein